MNADQLHVVCCVSNPVQYESRYRLYRQFAQHMADSGVRLLTVEMAFGEREFSITDADRQDHVRVRGRTELWVKENLINIGLGRLPESARYIAWGDADVTFRDPNWAQKTIDALQHYELVQPWSDCYDLGPNGEHVQHHRSFCRQYQTGQKRGPAYEYWHSGYFWAARRSALEKLGGLIETAALGAGDHHMALGLVGRADESLPGTISAPYRRIVKQWEARAESQIARNIGYVAGTIEHTWHGRKADRAYVSRWDILKRHAFDPDTDLKRNTWGVLELAGNKPALRDDMRKYFRARNEDSREM